MSYSAKHLFSWGGCSVVYNNLASFKVFKVRNQNGPSHQCRLSKVSRMAQARLPGVSSKQGSSPVPYWNKKGLGKPSL